MENFPKQIDSAKAEDVFDGGGEMGELMRSIDWSQTPLGPVSQWPQSVRLPVKICLTSRFPMILWWGPDLIMHYNDAWYPSLGTVKHPRAMGHPGQECYPEIWDTIGPMLHSVLDTGKATWSDNQMFFMERNGYKEECYFTFSYSPIRNEQGIVSGVFTAVAETTEQVLGQRRLNTLRGLGAQSSQGKTAEEACQIACQILEDNQADLPFGLIYLLNKDGKQATLCGTVGLPLTQSFGSPLLDLEEVATEGTSWPLDQVIAEGQIQLITNLGSQLGEFKILGQSVVPNWALILPLRSPGEDRAAGFMVAGLSPFRELNESYHSFVELVADSIATSIANATAYEAERKRAEALAELDRAKTAFFSNISHEFRTPLTLMLGPLEDAMANVAKDNPAALYERLEMIQRNGLRLLKLVNSLLDFSRIEAGRVQAVYKPTDVSTLTAELGSVFRAAIERAGLSYVVDCPLLDLAQPVYLDREMWEKIVFNLLSNAFKFTFEGWIGLRLRGYEDHIELEVRDSGTGIPAEQLPHLFERFHRVQEAKARTHEGSGIGLALVQELVKLHGGLVQVESVPGQGTTFRVILPLGKAHLPADRISAESTLASTRLTGQAYIEEALHWLPEEESKLSLGEDKYPAPIERETDRLKSTPHPAPTSTTSAPPGQENLSRGSYILLADDNADVRHYVRRLLSEQGYRVEVAENGLKALEEAWLEAPDLVLTDVMMPEMDGFELLAALRNDPATSRLPVILLSARAGEEAVIEGVKAGADDYLIKPFSARELLARVETHLKLTRVRQQVVEAQQSLTMALEAAQLGSWDLDLVSDTANYSPRYAQMFGYRELPAEWGHHLLREHVLSEDQAMVDESFEKALNDGTGQFRVEARIRWPDGTIHWLYSIGRVFYNSQRQPVRMAGVLMDLTERKQAEETIQKTNERFQIAETAANGLIYDWDTTTGAVWRSDGLSRVLDYGPDEIAPTNRAWEELIHPQDLLQLESEAIPWLDKTPGPHTTEYRVRHKNGNYIVMLDNALTIYDEQGHLTRMVGATIDITERKRMEEQLRESEERFRRVAQITSDAIWAWDLETDNLWLSEGLKGLFGYDPEKVGQDIEWWYDNIHPDDRERVVSGIHGLIDSGEQFWSGEYRFRHADGSYVYVADKGYVIHSSGRDNGTPKPVRMLGAFVNITQRKQKEEQARFLLDYGEKLRPLHEEEVVFEQSARLLGEYLKVERCYFAEINFETPQLINHANYCKNKVIQSLAGIYKLANSQWAEELQTMEPVMITDTTTDKIPSQFYAQLYPQSNSRSILIVPLHDGKRAKPFLTVIAEYTIQPHKWQEEEVSLVKLVLERVWLAVQNARLYRRAQLTAVLEERNRIARTLHDSLQQDFYIIQLQANTVLAILKREANTQLVERIGAHLNEILLQAEGGIAGLRSLIFDLHTEAVAREGLVAGLLTYLESLRTKYRLKVISYLGAEPRLKIEIKEALYWIAREALQNIIKHARASEVELTLSQPSSEPGVIELTIKDNGRGFDHQKVELGHLGLSTMRERAENCEGKVSVTSKIGQGTLVVATFRVHP